MEAPRTVEASKACVESWENMIGIILRKPWVACYSILDTNGLDYMSPSTESSCTADARFGKVAEGTESELQFPRHRGERL